MYITKIEKGKGRRYRVYSDEQLVFALYDKELKYYDIEENRELKDDTIDTILKDIILKCAKERALYLLERKMYTVSMMRDKLICNDYPESVVEQVLSFLREYCYLDDKAYVCMYIRNYSSKKSRKQLMLDLHIKGIEKQLVNDFFEEYEYSEEQCFARQFERYVRGKDLTNFSDRNKVFRYFYGKGFSTNLINEYMRNFSEV